MSIRADLRSLKPFIWPKFREEGPPERVYGVLLGRELLGEERNISPAAKSVLELATLGYRPVTSLAILGILSESPDMALHGMQIGRDLESLFQLPEGWFTRTRYYSDRVGKLLSLLVRLDILNQVEKDAKGGRTFPAYQVNPAAAGSVRARLEALTAGKRVSLFFDSMQESQSKVSPPRTPKECISCGVLATSKNARYCERCGKPLRIRCVKCRTQVDAVYAYCLTCGNKMS